jgi:bacterioferritin-associated ferredoxin
MIVCLCKGVSDRDVRAAIDAGSETVRDVGRTCSRAGTDCGACVGAVREMLQHRRRHRRTRRDAVGVRR